MKHALYLPILFVAMALWVHCKHESMPDDPIDPPPPPPPPPSKPAEFQLDLPVYYNPNSDYISGALAVQASDSSIYVCTNVYHHSQKDTFWLLHLKPNGDTLWSKTFPEETGRIFALHWQADQTLLVVGRKLLLTFDTQGNELSRFDIWYTEFPNWGFVAKGNGFRYISTYTTPSSGALHAYMRTESFYGAKYSIQESGAFHSGAQLSDGSVILGGEESNGWNLTGNEYLAYYRFTTDPPPFGDFFTRIKKIPVTNCQYIHPFRDSKVLVVSDDRKIGICDTSLSILSYTFPGNFSFDKSPALAEANNRNILAGMHQDGKAVLLSYKPGETTFATLKTYEADTDNVVAVQQTNTGGYLTVVRLDNGNYRLYKQNP